MAVDDVLTQLAELDQRQADIVEMRFFGGLTVAEVAEAIKQDFIAGILELRKRKKIWPHIKKQIKKKKTRGGKGAGIRGR